MDWLLYSVAKCLILAIQALPLDLVARLGRWGGGMVYWLDARHRRVARKNIARCFPEMSSDEVRSLVKENFRRIGESYACGIKTASMSADQLNQVLVWAAPDELTDPQPEAPPSSVVVALGHFANFELYVHSRLACPRFQAVSTYRGLPQESLNRLMRSLRRTSGCLFFERRSEGQKLRSLMGRPGIMLGLASDQDGGDRGVQLPFLGHNCSTSPAAALFALRYGCPLYTAICYRMRLARWRIEVGPAIPTHENGVARPTGAIMRDVNAAFEVAVRRDPANWFWVHNRWKRGRPDAALVPLDA
jgi:KDO2-lipid IV(A) lauroyltransferase